MTATTQKRQDARIRARRPPAHAARRREVKPSPRSCRSQRPEEAGGQGQEAARGKQGRGQAAAGQRPAKKAAAKTAPPGRQARRDGAAPPRRQPSRSRPPPRRRRRQAPTAAARSDGRPASPRRCVACRLSAKTRPRCRRCDRRATPSPIHHAARAAAGRQALGATAQLTLPPPMAQIRRASTAAKASYTQTMPNRRQPPPPVGASRKTRSWPTTGRPRPAEELTDAEVWPCRTPST